MTTETLTPFREDRQYEEPYADNEQVYRTIDLSNKQLSRLPMWARIAIAHADASTLHRDKTIAELLAALEGIVDIGDTERTIPLTAFERRRRWKSAEAAIRNARGGSMNRTDKQAIRNATMACWWPSPCPRRLAPALYHLAPRVQGAHTAL